MSKYPKYHFSEKKGWINDPNGCIYHNGEYHLFYQFNPHDTKWGPMHWGHVKTKDFVKWDYLPIALKPDQPYEDTDGCFSGSAVEKDGKLNLIYTATENKDGVYEQTQCLATETESVFLKNPANPLIKREGVGISVDFRDPKVIQHNDKYYMVLGSSTLGARENGDGQILLYESDDLEQWVYRGILFKSNGQYGTMFECPDLIKINNKWVLIFSPMFYGENKSTYIIGDCDLDRCIFKPEYSSEIDFGTDFYAPQSFANAEKNLIIAWQNGWEWMPWFENFGSSESYCGSMSLVRELDIVNNKLVSRPVSTYEKYFTLKETVELNKYHDMKNVAKLSSKNVKQGEILQLNFADEKVIIEFLKDEIIFDRSELNKYYTNKKHGSYEMKSINTLEIYIDTNSIELFINNGEFSMSCLVFPESEITSIETNQTIEIELYEFKQGE